MRERIHPVTVEKKEKTRHARTAESVVSYGHYLLMQAQTAGNMVLDGHRASAEEEAINLKLRSLCLEIERMLPSCNESDLALLIDIYEMAYGVCFRKMPDPNLTARCKRRIINAWKADKGNIEESTVFGIVSNMVRFPGSNPDRDIKETFETILKDWLLTLLRHNTFPRTTTYETYQRLALLMPLNLDKYLGDDSQEVKREWYEAHEIDNLSSVSSPILKSYRRYITSLPPYVLDYSARKSIEREILHLLSTRPDLDPHDRDAYRLVLGTPLP